MSQKEVDRLEVARLSSISICYLSEIAMDWFKLYGAPGRMQVETPPVFHRFATHSRATKIDPVNFVEPAVDQSCNVRL